MKVGRGFARRLTDIDLRPFRAQVVERDDRNEELEQSPVPDPEATDGDAADDPQAD